MRVYSLLLLGMWPVLHEATISVLANLSFPDNPMDDYEAFGDATIKAVNI